MTGSQQTMALLQAFDAEDQVSARPRLQHHRTGPDLRPPIEKRLILSPISPIKTKSFSSIPIAREKPLSDYPTAFRWTAPVTRPEDDNWESVANASPLSDGDKVHIGNLGQRRGFKGKPLTVSKWSRSSSFLSLPKGLNFSPNSSSRTSLDGTSPCSPRTPLEAVANRMRSVSVSVVSWSSGVKAPVSEVPQDLQDLYGKSDPFASHGNTFFAFLTDVHITATKSEIYQLGFYKRNRRPRKQSCLVKKNTPLQAVPHPAFTNARMKSTIYDLSTADVAPARVTVPVSRNTVADTLDVPEKSSDVADGIITVKSPTIVLTAPPSPTMQEADKDEPKFVDELPVSENTHELPGNSQQISEGRIIGLELKETNNAPRSALVEVRNTIPPVEQNQHEISVLATQPTSVLSILPANDCISNGGHANIQLPTFQYAEFPKVMYETCIRQCDDVPVPLPGDADALPSCPPIPTPQHRSSLRPLALPARVASRLSARITLIPEDDTGRSQALEGIIALLDVGITSQK
ncbi:hypothetical protein E4T56_gene7641 [Termitomyces sp. T112]|nr:hypothetical protein E4T56_gene7641 [Termitomyces sp. T112]KNZ71261.1 hypothetical protein J132_00098 [Termitomyces sp. J132]